MTINKLYMYNARLLLVWVDMKVKEFENAIMDMSWLQPTYLI